MMKLETPKGPRDRRLGRKTLSGKLEGGRVLEMSDRSRWQVQPDHEMYTEHWSDRSVLTVVPGGYGEYPYDLIHRERGDRVPARYLGYRNPELGWRLSDA